MENENLLKIFKIALIRLFKNYAIIIPTVSLWIFFILFSYISIYINNRLETTILLTIWLILFSLISLCVSSFFLSSLIGISKDILKERIIIKKIFYYGRVYWIKNLFIILIIVLIYNSINFISNRLASLIGNMLALDVEIAKWIFFLFYFSGMAGIIIFLTYSSFFLIIKKTSIRKSVLNSFFLVKIKYISTLSIILVFFIINGLINLLDNRILTEAINTFLIFPYFSLVLSKFVLINEKNDL